MDWAGISRSWVFWCTLVTYLGCYDPNKSSQWESGTESQRQGE